MDDTPIDYFHEASSHAMRMREFYDAYERAGFTEAEAFHMVTILLAGITGQR